MLVMSLSRESKALDPARKPVPALSVLIGPSSDIENTMIFARASS